MVIKKAKTKKVAVTKGKGKNLETVREVEIPLSENPEIMDGTTKAKAGKVSPKGQATISLALGATLNMDNYQSARIDVFIQRNVEDTDEGIKDGLEEISDMLHEEMERQTDLLQ